MILNEQSASKFIDGYKRLLLEIDAAQEQMEEPPLLERLVASRTRLTDEPSLLQKCVAALTRKSDPLDAEIVEAVESLKVKNWIFLRDTRTYSIFMDPEATSAYAVVGLTDRLRDIVGGSGAVVEAGLVRYAGHFVCDGLISSVVWLGRGYKADFTRAYAAIRAEGRFFRHSSTSQEPPDASQATLA